jgi:hypothetical protein
VENFTLSFHFEKFFIMHVDEFRRYQREGATANLFSLVMSCRRKFLNAARLLELNSNYIESLSDFGVSDTVDLWPLLNPFIDLTERYVEHFFSSQDNLFHLHMERQDEQWSKYFHQILIPHLLANDEVVRNILRAVRALPSKNPDDAVISLNHYFKETTLPETAPAWDPEDFSGY